MRWISLAVTVVALTFSFVVSASAVPSYDFEGLDFYQFGAPADVLAGSPTGGPDTGFIRITNAGTSTFTGTIGFNAITGGGVDQSATYPITLNPGSHASIAVDTESSNVGGFGGPSGTTQTGAQYELKGNVCQGLDCTAVDLTIFDSDIHSGVSRTNPFGVTLDNYILQGGDPLGRDTGDAYETTQAAGAFSFTSGSVGGSVPLPATWLLLGSSAGVLTALRRFRRR